MTSHLNHLQIEEYFYKKNYFGLQKEQIDFFVQNKAPFLDEKGNWIIQDDKIVQAPDGNGSIFSGFYKNNIYLKYFNNNIKYLSIVPIDNPLCDPFDEALFGFHKNKKNDVTIKCIKREDPNENKGAIVFNHNKIKIVEYLDLDPLENYYFSNTGIYLININFFQKMKDVDLKYNYVLKKISSTNEKIAFKSENFIFDFFDYAKKVNILVDNKQNFYAPIKDISNTKEIEKLLSLEKPTENMLK